ITEAIRSAAQSDDTSIIRGGKRPESVAINQHRNSMPAEGLVELTSRGEFEDRRSAVVDVISADKNRSARAQGERIECRVVADITCTAEALVQRAFVREL